MSKDETFARQCARDWWDQSLSQQYTPSGVASCDSCDAPIRWDEGLLCNPLDAPDVRFISDVRPDGLSTHVEWQEWIVAAVKRGGLPGLGSKRIGGLPGPHLVCEACFGSRPYVQVEPNFYLWYLAERARPANAMGGVALSTALPAPMDTNAGSPEPAAATGGVRSTVGLASTPHQNADPHRATQLSLKYLEARAAWKSLPWWKRILSKEPEPPQGI